MLECRCNLIVSVFLAVSAGFTAAPDMSARVCAVGEHTRFVKLLLAARYSVTWGNYVVAGIPRCTYTRSLSLTFLSSQLAAAYLEFLVDGDGEGVDGAGEGGGGAEHGRGREEQLKRAFQRVNLPVSSNQGNSQHC